MHKLITVFLLLGAISTSRAQRQEITLGVNRNHFYDFHQTSRAFDARDDYGVSLGWSFEQVYAQKIPYRLTLKFDQYKGSVNVFNGGLGGGTTIQADVTKNMITLGLYPLVFSFKHKLDLDLGLELNALVREKAKGYHDYYQGGAPPVSYHKTLDDGATKVSFRLGMGLSGRLAYHIPLRKGWSLVPQYLVFYGLGDEFIIIQSDTRSIRHCLAMGIAHKPHLKQAVKAVD